MSPVTNEANSNPAYPLAGLPTANQLLALFPNLKSMLGESLQVHVVIDTNRLYDEILFLARKRRQPEAKTSLLELLDAGTIIGYFPQESIHELEEKVKEISNKYHIPLGEVSRISDQFRMKLHFCKIGTGGHLLQELKNLRDPTDAPFLELQHFIAADAVLTTDKDLLSLGLATIPWLEIHLDLRNYARAKQVELSISLGGVVITGLGVVSIIGSLYALGRAFAKLPPGLQILLGIGIGAALIHPTSRAAIAKNAKSIGARLFDAWESIEPVVNEMRKIAETSRNEAERGLGKIKHQIPSASRLTLAQAAYRVCITTRTPLTTHQIWEILQMKGIKMRARDPVKKLDQLLEANPNLVRNPEGKWKFANSKE